MEEDRCENCDESWLPAEDNAQACCHCGSVREDAGFVSSRIHYYEPPNRRPDFNCNSQAWARLNVGNPNVKRKKAIALSHGLSQLSNLCSTYKITHEKELQMQALLDRLHKGRNFRYKEDMGVLAGVCVYLMQKRNSQPIRIIDICRYLNCSSKRFSNLLKYIRKSSDNENDLLIPFEENNSVVAENYPEERDKDVKLPDIAESLILLLCSDGPEEDKDEMIVNTTALVKLSYSCWLFTGRSPRATVIACAFLCWKSIKRNKVTFKSFCNFYKIENPEPVIKTRVKELLKLLLKLGQKIPSFTQNYVNKQNVLFHLNTILANSLSLRNDVLQDNKLEDKRIDSEEYEAFRIVSKTKPRTVSTTAYDSDMNASDIEISDREIDSYIISDNRKDNFKKLLSVKSKRK